MLSLVASWLIQSNKVLLVLFSIALTACKSNIKHDNQSDDVALIVGSFSNGIYQVSYNKQSNTFGKTIRLAEIPNPSFLALTNSHVYSVSETQGSHIISFKREPSSLKLIDQQATGGSSSTHLSLDSQRNLIGVASYSSGDTAFFSVNDKTGEIGGPRKHFDHAKLQKSSAVDNKKEKKKAHSHWVGWSLTEEYIFVADLGMDQILSFPFDASNDQVGDAQIALQMGAGDGPRHMTFHPTKNIAYILNQHSSTLVTTSVNSNGKLNELQKHSTLPEGYSGKNATAHIQISEDGKNVYVSNRGHNSIAHFTIEEDGSTQLGEITSCEGNWPRAFALFDKHKLFFCANTKSSTITAFKVGGDGRLISLKSQAQVPAPTFIAEY